MNPEATGNVAMAMDTEASTTNGLFHNTTAMMPENAPMILVRTSTTTTTTTTSLAAATSASSTTCELSSRSYGKANKKKQKQQLWKMRLARKAKNSKKQKNRRIRRLWQLPESSILEYTKWIQDKPEEDRTRSEERFLWKCLVRSLGAANDSNNNHNNEGGKPSRQERIREFVDRLETKEPMELTENERHFVRLYRKRRNHRKAQILKHRQQQNQQQQQQQESQTISWMRSESQLETAAAPTTKKAKKSKKKKATTTTTTTTAAAGFESQAGLESLRESMNRMGLSSDKLKHVRFADPPMLMK